VEQPQVTFAATGIKSVLERSCSAAISAAIQRVFSLVNLGFT